MFLNSFFPFGQMPIPDSAGQRHNSVVKGGGFMAVYRCNAAQAFSPANGVLDLDAPTGMRLIDGALGLGQGRVWVLFAAPGLAVGQAFGSHAIVGDEAQVAQIGQHLEQVKQAQVDVGLLV